VFIRNKSEEGVVPSPRSDAENDTGAASRQLRVVHFCRQFSNLSETFVYDYIIGLERSEVDCYVFTLRRLSTPDRPFAKTIEIKASALSRVLCKIRRAMDTVNHNGGDRPDALPVYRSLKRNLLVHRPDILHCHFGHVGIFMLPVAKQLGIPMIVTLYGHDISRLIQDETWIERYTRLWEYVSYVTVLSEEMRDRVHRIGCPMHKINVVHLGRDVHAIEFRKPRRKVKKFVTVGRLVEKKGFGDVIKAIHMLEGTVDAHLTIIGDGPLRGDLERYVRENEMEDRIRFTGPLPNKSVIAELRKSDAFILCSKTAADGDKEGTPTVFIEAQAVGLPCIGTRHAGIPEMVPIESRWLLAAEGDIADIADRMRDLTAMSVSDLQAIAVRGRRKVEKEYHIQAQVREIKRLYQSI
jgi:colanic acid/amylovoran biosynthesis glycosyltransferase